MPPYHSRIHASAGTIISETIVYKSDGADRVIEVCADECATVRLICTGVQIAGSLTLTLTLQPGAQIFVGLLVRVSGTDRLEIRSTQMHTNPQGTSRLWVRKIVADDAVATYHGTVHIAQTATGTIVSQDDKSLIDGHHARAESTPILEVLTHEVVCNHGSALGTVDAHTLWYIQTRGLLSDDARELWYAAFFDEVSQMILREG